MENNQTILIWGAPGAGKTTFSEKLKETLGYPLVEGDYLREVVAQREMSEAEDPFVYVGTKAAWRHYGELTNENVIKGLESVRKSMAGYVRKEIAKHSSSFIFEAAFLIPAEYTNAGCLVLVDTEDVEQHQRQYFEHRERNENNLLEFEAARILRNYFLDEAIQTNALVVKNSGDMDRMTQSFINQWEKI